MNKPFRFMTEYANYTKKCLDACEMMNSGIRAELKRRIDHAIRMYEKGLITVDECMRLIARPGDNEDMSEYMTA